MQRFCDLAAGFPSCCRAVQGFSGFAGGLSDFPWQFACTEAREVGKPAAGGSFPCTAVRKLGKPARGKIGKPAKGQTAGNPTRGGRRLAEDAA